MVCNRLSSRRLPKGNRGRQPGSENRNVGNDPETTQRRWQSLNTNGLAKLYDRLTAKERLPLILASSARGDQTERDRLAHSGPKKEWRMPDYYGLAEAMLCASLFHLLQVLDVAVIYWQANGLYEQEKALGKKANKAFRDRFNGLARMFAYLFTLEL